MRWDEGRGGKPPDREPRRTRKRGARDRPGTDGAARVADGRGAAEPALQLAGEADRRPRVESVVAESFADVNLLGSDGELRRHAGRCEVHTGSKRAYDERMAGLVKRYLANHPEPGLFEFLRVRSAELRRAFGGVAGIVVPRPKMVPVG